MNRKNLNQFSQFNQVKTHFKMYKSGKLWLVSIISVFGIGLTSGTAASADDTTTSSENIKVNDQQPHYNQREVTLGLDQAQSQVSSVATSQTGMSDASFGASQSQSQSASGVDSQAQQDSKNSVRSVETSEASVEQEKTKGDNSSSQNNVQGGTQSSSKNTHSTLVQPQLNTEYTNATASGSTKQNSSSQGAGQVEHSSQSTNLDLGATQNHNISQTDSQSASQSESQSQEISSAVNLNSLAGNARTEITPDQLRDSKLTTTDDVQSEDNIKVSPDSDPNRQNFESTIGNNTGSTPTSVNIPLPDQIVNDANYRKNAISVSDYNQLVSAWGDEKVQYINIVNDITYDSTKRAMPYRTNGASIIINGNGHTIDLGTQNFKFYNITKPTTATFTNSKFQQGFAWNDGDVYSLVYAAMGSQLTVNADNITLRPSASNGNNPIHFVTSIGAKVNFSGTNYFNISNEVSRGVGKIVFSNNAKVTMQRTSNDIGFSQYYFQNNITDTSAVGYGNTITMGDGSSNEGYTYQGRSANYPAMYLYVKGVQAGDNVTWKQSGFQYFLNTNQAGAVIPNDAVFSFGQNFQLIAPITTRPGAIQIRQSQQVIFNAGTVLDINQRSTQAIIQTDGTSQVKFISPKYLHLANIWAR